MNVTRYFVAKPDQVRGYNYSLTPDNDILALDVLKNSAKVYEDDDKVILLVIISDKTQARLADIAEVDDALSLEAVSTLDILGSYGGMSKADLFFRFPELEGQKQIGTNEDGQPIMVDIVADQKWFGFNHNL